MRIRKGGEKKEKNIYIFYTTKILFKFGVTSVDIFFFFFINCTQNTKKKIKQSVEQRKNIYLIKKTKQKKTIVS